MDATKIDHKMWERMAKRKTNAELKWALKDLRMVMSLHKDKPLDDPTMLRWLAEEDACRTEAGKRGMK